THQPLQADLLRREAAVVERIKFHRAGDGIDLQLGGLALGAPQVAQDLWGSEGREQGENAEHHQQLEQREAPLIPPTKRGRAPAVRSWVRHAAVYARSWVDAAGIVRASREASKPFPALLASLGLSLLGAGSPRMQRIEQGHPMSAETEWIAGAPAAAEPIGGNICTRTSALAHRP